MSRWLKPPGCPRGWPTAQESASTSTPPGAAKLPGLGNATSPALRRPHPQACRVELAAARDQIGHLRAERDKLRDRLRLQLGVEIDGPDRAQLIGRLAELETVNRQLVAERDARRAEAEVARRHVVELEDDLTAARESLRRVIRSENRGRTS